ncbi:sodium-coupled monocarboxylate transporter 1-like [Babylonia areolata]|uniref:sodium-coupled monocarboxylate transporter 1-like n=1 Tax=Babylonia areolata TaxID=304850 RepID=UPI003FD213CD
MVDPSHSFHIADYIVFGITIVVSIGIGIYYALAGDRQRTTSEYLVGGRAMKFLPVAISLMVSFESSIMMLGLPAEMYVYGVQWWLGTLGFFVSQILSVFIMVPLLHPLGITSAYEYLELRFNSTAVRLLGSFLGMLVYVWYMGIVLFGPAIALEAVTGFPQWSSVFVVAFVAIVYTSIGGLKAVIWTDVFQSFVMYAGMFAILIKGTMDVGGASKVWEIASDKGRLDFFDFDLDPRTRHTFWSVFLGSLIRGFGLAFNQSTVQRVSSTKSQKEARWVLLVMAPCFMLSMTMACYEGIVAFAYYQTVGCDPLASKKITNPNQIIPFTVMDIFKSLPGMPGLFLASLFSASLSTLSSGLSSLSALMWTDFLKPRIGEVSEFKATVIAKTCVVLFGLCGCGVAILVSLVGGTLTQITASLLAAFNGPLTGLFLLGSFCPWANSKGALVGALISLAFSAWLSMGSVFSKKVKKTPWLPLATTDKCWADVNASLLLTTTPFTTSPSYYGNATVAMYNESHYDFDSVYGFQFDGADFYDYYTSTSAASSSLLESTTAQAVPESESLGIDAMYTLSYMWLAPVGIFVTLIFGSLFSVLTGGNKKGEVHPRYLISLCDNLCCCLPECVLKLFRCADDYSSVKNDDLPPAHELYLDTEFVIAPPQDPVKDSAAKEDAPTTATATLVTELSETLPATGNDVKRGAANHKQAAPEEPQNNGVASVVHSDGDCGNGDVSGGGDASTKDGDGEGKREEIGGGEGVGDRGEEGGGEKEGEGEEEESADSPETRLLQEDNSSGQVRSFIGVVIGDVIGEVTGEFVGEVIGEVIGDVIYEVIGKVIGEVIDEVIGEIIGEVIGEVVVFASDQSWRSTTRVRRAGVGFRASLPLSSLHPDVNGYLSSVREGSETAEAEDLKPDSLHRRGFETRLPVQERIWNPPSCTGEDLEPAFL